MSAILLDISVLMNSFNPNLSYCTASHVKYFICKGTFFYSIGLGCLQAICNYIELNPSASRTGDVVYVMSLLKGSSVGQQVSSVDRFFAFINTGGVCFLWFYQTVHVIIYNDGRR